MTDGATTKPPAFVSLGMVVVDELRSPGHAPILDSPGGSGAFAVLGARIVAGPERAGDVGCCILAGDDFPASVLATFRAWNVQLRVQVDATRQSTRGLLEYHDAAFSQKSFRYTTPPLQPTPADLPVSWQRAAGFHLLASPAAVEQQIAQIHQLCGCANTDRPLLVWEPLPLAISQDARAAHLAACRHVDVFSPNHLELMALFQGPVSDEDAADDRFDKNCIARYADACLASGVGPDGRGAVVVRAGSVGCLVASLHPSKYHRWLPAYAFGPGSGRTVVDATGAGNTFLGAFAFAQSGLGRDAVEAAQLATVAASFALEQTGLPLADSQDGRETWNGEAFSSRHSMYETRNME